MLLGMLRRYRSRKARLGGPYEFMRKVLATERGTELYARRLGIVEPVFARPKAEPTDRTHQTKRPSRRAPENGASAATHNPQLHRQTSGPAVV
jgi:hypothetical protein